MLISANIMSSGGVKDQDILIEDAYCLLSTTKTVAGNSGIVSFVFIKMCREANLLDNLTFRNEDADILFSKMKRKGQIKLDLRGFRVSPKMVNDFHCFDGNFRNL